MLGPVIAALLASTPPNHAGGPAEPAEPQADIEREEELVCRRRLIPAERLGERFRSLRVCKTREEWEEDARARRR